MKWFWQRKPPPKLGATPVPNGHEESEKAKETAERWLELAKRQRMEAQRAARDLRKQRDYLGEAIQKALGT